MEMKHEVISAQESIRAGEIRIELKSECYATITRYSRNLDLDSGVILGEIDLCKYIMESKWEFLLDVKRILLRDHISPKMVRITEDVMQFLNE